MFFLSKTLSKIFDIALMKNDECSKRYENTERN